MGPINVVREHHSNANLLFVGTEFRVHVSVDGGMSWTDMQNNMPTQPVHDLKIHPRENDLVVATHGRGIYIADIAPLAEFQPMVVDQPAHFFQPEDKVRWEGFDFTNYASDNYNGESEPMAVPLYYYLGVEAPGVTFKVYQGNVVLAEIEGEGSEGLHHVMWNMDRREERSENQQRAMRARFERFGQTPNEDQIRWVSTPAAVGEYRVVMEIAGREIDEHTVSILKDEWVMMRR